VQTFLPFADFRQSASVLDQARLGKQRVEALQVLRAIVLPTYGWQSHPAMQMWRGYVPALTRYALDMVDEWTDRGNADSTRPLITEFAPEAALDTTALAMPSWMGNEELHLSHRSNLVRKAPEHYAPLFPGVPNDLPYLWPGPDGSPSPGAGAGAGANAGAAAPAPAGVDAAPVATATADTSSLPPVLWILRPRNAEEFDDWTTSGAVTLGEVSPRGRVTPKWQAQLEVFAALEPGTPVAVLTVDGARLVRGIVADAVMASENGDGELVLRLPVEFQGELERAAFPYPALLQDPRTVFSV
jgi:hypothetical protein